jgi:lysozyme family protein
MDDELRFNFAVNVILNHEISFCDDKNDPADIKNFGINRQFVLDNKIYDIDNDQLANEYVKSLNKNEATKIYKRYFWDRYHYDLFESLDVATKVFDMTVSLGHMESHKLLQLAINQMSHNKLLIDGICGIKTFSKANKLPNSFLIEELRAFQKQFYEILIKIEPENKRFLNTWLNRANW